MKKKGQLILSSDRLFYIVVLVSLLISMGSLLAIKDAEQRCDQRYSDVIKKCYHTQDNMGYNHLQDINISMIQEEYTL